MIKNFKNFLKELSEETTSGDIATVTTKLDLVKRPKPCKKHNVIDCKECKDQK
jgi:hypothetical protein